MQLMYLIIGLFGLFNLILAIWLYRVSSHYNSLTKGIDKKTLHNVLEGIQKTLSNHERELVVNKKEIQKLYLESKSFIRYLTLKRFNPYSDTGGNQSFLLGIMDGNKDGVVITSLHSRESTRFYIKQLKSGEGVEHPLTKDEKKLLNY